MRKSRLAIIPCILSKVWIRARIPRIPDVRKTIGSFGKS